jgi:N-methylhydantoinase A
MHRASSSGSTVWSVGTDTGGTFTDLVALSDRGEIRVSKTPSTPPAFESGVVDALQQAEILPASVNAMHHGTTVTTNALITRTGARTALLTTAGFRDVLEVRRANRAKIYDIQWDPPVPLIPRYNRFEVTERIDYAGAEIVPLAEDEVRRIAKVLGKRGIEAVCVAFIHSYVDNTHERRAKQLLEEELPDAFVCCSAELVAEPQEFERLSTGVANAYVGPVLHRYLRNVQAAMRANGFSDNVHVMHSGGGTLTTETANAFPIRTAASGPAAGVMAAAALAEVIGRPNVVSLDMGGTSADIATIIDGRPRLTLYQELEWGMPIGFPSIDLVAIGAGGGSIAWIDGGGVPHSGPQSAGAVPGPACYGTGGVEPTTTDANLVLGRLRAGSLLGGRIRLDERLARDAIQSRIADPLHLDVLAAAEGIVRIANENMANAIHRVTVQRGVDPRGLTLIAFGGAGPMHAVEVARALRMPEVVIPPAPGATSALGLLFTDTRHDLVQSYIVRTTAIDAEEIERRFREMESAAGDLLAGDVFSEVRLERSMDLRYEGQVRVLALPIDARPFAQDTVLPTVSSFHDSYEAEFRYAIPDMPVEVRALRVAAIGVRPKPEFRPQHGQTSVVDARTAMREVHFGDNGSAGFVQAAAYDRAKLPAGATVDGPAIIEQFDSTTVLPPDSQLTVDQFGNLIIRTGA